MHTQQSPPDLTDIMSKAFGKGKGVLITAVSIFFLVMSSLQALYTIEEGHVGIIKRFGEATQQVNPGLHIKIPFIDTVEVLEIRTRKNVERLNASTYEQMPITAEISINWTVQRSQAFELYKSYGGLDQFESRILDPKLRSAAKDALARDKAEEIIQNRSKVIAQIESLLIEGMRKYPVKLGAVDLS